VGQQQQLKHEYSIYAVAGINYSSNSSSADQLQQQHQTDQASMVDSTQS
jgi:hypothetical protein